MAELEKSTSSTRTEDAGFLFSTHAEQMMSARGISPETLHDAMRLGTSRAAKEPGREVIRYGNLRIVVERNERSVKVLTAMYEDDLVS